ncbi:hypothetical protein HQQ81_02025 [Microbacteriaceae bacterium VKM Ac-2854]|nr:hypothetical protein [Microbacteriaceae bacterium VKM Ac-2854]
MTQIVPAPAPAARSSLAAALQEVDPEVDAAIGGEMFTLIQPGDTIRCLDVAQGGHVTHRVGQVLA